MIPLKSSLTLFPKLFPSLTLYNESLGNPQVTRNMLKSLCVLQAFLVMCRPLFGALHNWTSRPKVCKKWIQITSIRSPFKLRRWKRYNTSVQLSICISSPSCPPQNIGLLCRYLPAASFAKLRCKANSQGNRVDKERLKSLGNCWGKTDLIIITFMAGKLQLLLTTCNSEGL